MMNKEGSPIVPYSVAYAGASNKSLNVLRTVKWVNGAVGQLLLYQWHLSTGEGPLVKTVVKASWNTHLSYNSVYLGARIGEQPDRAESLLQ